jgi:aminoglycoside/choline kinase family phosphotransferase
MTQSIEALTRLFRLQFGAPPDQAEELSGQLGGSARRMVRLSGAGTTAIGVLYDVREENVAFVEFSRHFRGHGLPVPRIYAADLDRNAYIEEDLGDTTLFQFLASHRSGERIAPEAAELYRRVARILPRFQVEAGRDLDYGVCYPRAAFDRQSIAWDLNYFKYCFLRPAGIPFDEQALEDDFGRLTDLLLAADTNYFLYRDFQSRNVMLRDGELIFIDYQGGRRGALQYDIASLVYDAKADLPDALRAELLETYLDALAAWVPLDRASFMEYFYPYVYVRIMQAMGAYGFLGLIRRKQVFLDSVPYALGNLRGLLDRHRLPISVPALTSVFERMIDSGARIPL